MDTKQALEILKKEGIFWSRLGFSIDPPIFDENNNNILNENSEIYFKYHRDMTNAGVKVHTCILSSGWIDDNKYDFKTPMKILTRLMEENPDIYFMPRIKLNPPILWQKRYPEDICVYENGPRDAEGILSLIGGEKHNIHGDGKQGTVIANQSLSSENWIESAKRYLEKFIDIIEKSKYADRIIGYHLGYGRCGETHMWGGMSMDFGINERRSFYKFGLDKYKSKTELEKRWGVQNISADTVPIPTCDEYLKNTNEISEFFHYGDQYASYIDYNTFRRKVSYDAVCELAKSVKKQTDKVVGFFHGYILNSGADRHGHTDLEEVLNCPYIDFICAPKSYYRNEMGEPGGYYCPPLSVNRKKLWFDEVDYPNDKNNAADFVKVLWREFAKDISLNTPFWWMDLLGGWYDDAYVRKNISYMLEIKQKLKDDRKTCAEILLVVDENSAMFTSQNETFQTKTMQETQAQVALSGMPYDMYRLCDLNDISLDKYKVIFFINCFKISEQEKEWIHNKVSAKTTLVFNYAFGIMSDVLSLKNVTENTGFILSKIDTESKIPYFEILNDDVTVLYRYNDLKKIEETANCGFEDISNGDMIAAATITRKDGGKNIMFAVPSFTSELFRKIAEEAGCEDIAPFNTTVYADSRFLSIFAHSDISKSIKLHGEYYDVMQNRTVSDVMHLNMKKGDFVFLIKKTCKKDGTNFRKGCYRY